MKPLLREKQITGDSQVSYGGGEKPQYRALAQAIDGMYADLLRPLAELERETFMLLGLPQAKQEEERFRFTSLKKGVLDRALEIFFAEIAGPDRSREGYVNGGPEADTPDGVLQQWQRFSLAVGMRRGADLVDRPQTLSAERNSPATRAMLDNAFTRLSENGKLRLEGIRDELQSILTSATEAGLGPLDTARQLSGRFTQYKRFEFERLARTEAAFAAIEGSREQMTELGVRLVQWELNPSACPICQSFDGLILSIEDTDRHPPGHPQCLCDLVPA